MRNYQRRRRSIENDILASFSEASYINTSTNKKLKKGKANDF